MGATSPLAGATLIAAVTVTAMAAVMYGGRDDSDRERQGKRQCINCGSDSDKTATVLKYGDRCDSDRTL